MRLLLVTVGHRPPDWVRAGYAAYAARMPRETRLELVELAPAARGQKRGAPGPKAREQVQEREAAAIRQAMPKGARLVVLDETGRTAATADVARWLDGWRHDGRDVVLVVGGADGTLPALRAEADLVWSLSPLTFPHALVRVLVAEQLYRAWSVLANHPYHREG